MKLHVYEVLICAMLTQIRHFGAKVCKYLKFKGIKSQCHEDMFSLGKNLRTARERTKEHFGSEPLVHWV